MPPRSIQKARDFLNKWNSSETRRIQFSRLWQDLTLNLPNSDLMIICKDNVPIFCHQSIVAGASGFLRTMLQNISLKNGDDSFRINEDATIFLPEEESEVIKKCLLLLYDGLFAIETSPESKRITKEMKNTWKNVLHFDVVKINTSKGEIECKPSEKKIVERNFGVWSFEEETNREDDSNEESNQQEQVYDDFNPEQFTLHEEVPAIPKMEKLDHALKHLPQKGQSKVNANESKNLNFHPLNEEVPATPRSSTTKRKLSAFEENLQNAMKQATELTNKKLKESEAAHDDDNDQNVTLLPEETIRSLFDIKTMMPRRVPENSNIAYSVERVHVCVICNGKKDGKPDKEASSLSFLDLKKLKQHYSKHFYAEGKIVQHYPLESRNMNEDGSIKDEYGKIYRYECNQMSSTKPGEQCWKRKKKNSSCGYKEIALHTAEEHGLFETIVAKDTRPEIMNGLILKLQDYRNEM